jgi:nucleotide-binding universal stress UspA family protein
VRGDGRPRGEGGHGLVALPPIRSTLERWGLLEKGSGRSDVFDRLGITAQKLSLAGKDALGASVDWLAEHPTDLLVLSTEGRTGLPRWIKPSMAEKLAQETRTMTLFVPNGTRGIVSLRDGSVQMERILVPVDHRPQPQSAVEYARRAARLRQGEPVEIVVLHVGDGSNRPELDYPDEPGVTWTPLDREGDVVETIAGAAEELFVDLMVMATEGKQGILDAVRGTVTEQVLRDARCPLLAVPMA